MLPLCAPHHLSSCAYLPFQRSTCKGRYKLQSINVACLAENSPLPLSGLRIAAAARRNACLSRASLCTPHGLYDETQQFCLQLAPVLLHSSAPRSAAAIHSCCFERLIRSESAQEHRRFYRKVCSGTAAFR